MLLFLLFVGLFLPAIRSLHHLQYLTSFEGGAGHEGDGLADVAALHADHVGVLVVPEVGDLLRLLQPRVPDHRVRKVVLLQTNVRCEKRLTIFIHVLIFITAVDSIVDSGN